MILGPYFDEFLRRSLIVSEGDPTIFLRSLGERDPVADDASVGLVPADPAGAPCRRRRQKGRGGVAAPFPGRGSPLGGYGFPRP